MFEHSAITDQGRALMAACIAAGHPIEFTAYTLGSGTYTDAEKTVAQLKTRQSLKVQKQSFSFTSATSVGAEAILKVQVDNDGLAAGYYMTEAGIWAKDATDNVTPAILYQIGVDDTPSYMPDEDTSPLTIDTECHTVIDNDAEVTFTFTHGAYAWSDDLGDITQLSTTNKDSAVDAINELDSDLGDIEDKFDSDGLLKITKGGTQASNGDDALVNLGAISQHAVSICNWPDEAVFNFRGGRYFYHQLKYYRATKNISAGDTLVPTGVGANCEEVDLADEIERKASIKTITDNIEYDFKCTKAAGYDIDDLVYIECADQLYKVTAAIIQNESMSTSSNIKKWSVEDETRELSSELTYSSSSAVKVGKWIGGEDLYRKVYTSTGTGARNFDITETHANIVKMEAILRYGVYCSEPYYGDNTDYWNYYVANDKKVYLRCAGISATSQSTLVLVVYSI